MVKKVAGNFPLCCWCCGNEDIFEFSTVAAQNVENVECELAEISYFFCQLEEDGKDEPMTRDTKKSVNLMTIFSRNNVS